MFNLFDRAPSPNDDEARHLKIEMLRELLRQCRYSFNLALAVSAISAVMTVLGVFTQAPEAAIAAGGSTLAHLRIVQLAKETQDKLIALFGNSH